MRNYSFIMSSIRLCIVPYCGDVAWFMMKSIGVPSPQEAAYKMMREFRLKCHKVV